jgi:hypothetical protein
MTRRISASPAAPALPEPARFATHNEPRITVGGDEGGVLKRIPGPSFVPATFHGQSFAMSSASEPFIHLQAVRRSTMFIIGPFTSQPDRPPQVGHKRLEFVHG